VVPELSELNFICLQTDTTLTDTEEKDAGTLQENDGSYSSDLDFFCALCQRERHIYFHLYHGASRLFQHSQQ